MRETEIRPKENVMSPSALPARVIHADWSMHPQKRWAAQAQLRGDHYFVRAPAPTTPEEVLALLAEPDTLAGFDFPIGIPAAYAAHVGLGTFMALLAELGKGRWEFFFDVARTKEEISLHRPFYPHSSGGRKREHLVEKLNLGSQADLYRRCDTAVGRRACPIFWTLGGNQVGKGALTGWREVLIPALATGRVHIWPFEGSLEELLARKQSVLVETYPGDVYPYVGAALPAVAGGRGKRIQASRAKCAEGILAWAKKAHVELSGELEAELRGGFGPLANGEDRFDAAIGALGMIAVLQGLRPIGIPDDPRVRASEGWILGRAA
jgi:hypothetical protein